MGTETKRWNPIERNESTSDLGCGLRVETIIGVKGRREIVIFNGVRFYRYPDSKYWAHRAYFQPHIHAVRKGVGALHVELWKSVHGEVPKGHSIHHRDHNPLNNADSNFEPLTRSEHNSHHGRTYTPEYLAWKRKNMEYMQELAKAWHGSTEGKAWHREHAKKTGFTTPDKVNIVCAYAGCRKSFLGRPFWDKYCTPLCKQRDKNGVVLATKQCSDCGADYQTGSKSRNRKFCGRFGCERKAA